MSHPPGSPTVDAVMFHLKVAAGRWETIADDLGINKELVEEIDSNNETNEACLQGCIEKWVTTLSPSWEKLGRVLEDLGEHSLAEQVYSEGEKEKMKNLFHLFFIFRQDWSCQS